jgi:hypothetical protein
MTPDVAVVISLNRFMAPVDDTVTAQHKSQVTSHSEVATRKGTSATAAASRPGNEGGDEPLSCPARRRRARVRVFLDFGVRYFPISDASIRRKALRAFGRMHDGRARAPLPPEQCGCAW